MAGADHAAVRDVGAAFCGAAFVPGMPHLLAERPADSWRELADAARAVGEELRAQRPDVFVVLSTQWFTVLGHQLQMDPRPAGTRVDENWYAYDYGTLPYGFGVDVELSERWAQEIEGVGLQARRTRYDEFPIDSGIIVARALLDPADTTPVVLVSCNLYAGPDDISVLGRTALRACAGLGRRAAFVAVSGLSSALTQRWIEPHEDRVEDPELERWDRRMLDLLGRGQLDEAMALRDEYARVAQADSQLRALAFLAGTGCLGGPADVRAYGPVWGTGAAVIHWPDKRSTPA